MRHALTAAAAAWLLPFAVAFAVSGGGGGALAADTAPAGGAPAGDPVTRGAYVFHAAGCLGCHSNEKEGGAPLAGGRALATPFGTFHTPNITPDPETGIGRWSDADFIRAFREGVRPDGAALFPAFPYASYTRMTDRDLLDLKAYLFSRPAVAAPNRPHDLTPPFSWRFLLPVWQWMYLSPGPVPDDPAKPPAWNRGRYLVDALGHCGECHSPRTLMGGMESDRYLAGNPDGPDGDTVPGITSARSKGIGGWSDGDLTLLLETGLTPEGDVVGGAMGEVVRNSTSKLTAEDRAAIAAYLKTVPAKE
ncbi:diheme cytochrome C-type [Azospirillum humicireducens]|uniref:Diheme cytochrome C-type n=1 Tax=Azospirillum humicireducens TaxID=1226968 RepID=A0A160JJ67_9PROT|nr:cytochrome c [Azospirillum humicireducens]ANC93249.2 diheme cytochrome C-type [Azospirillum humicireducens]